jgi:hypothetical protein
MKPKDSIYTETVQLQGVSDKAEIGWVAANGLSRIKKEPGKKYHYELLRGLKCILFEIALTYKYKLLSY